MGDRYYVTDSDLSARFPLYTRANVGEVFPDPVTPLTSSSALWEAELGWRPNLGLDAMCESVWAWQSKNPEGFGGGGAGAAS